MGKPRVLVCIYIPFSFKKFTITSKDPVAFNCVIGSRLVPYQEELQHCGQRLTEKLIACPLLGCEYVTRFFDAGKVILTPTSRTPGQYPPQARKSYSPLLDVSEGR
jgi:hypothetical protein